MTLTIISHTEHYKTANGQIVGFGPTVMEINSLLNLFDRIVHVAMLHDGTPPAHAMAYQDKRIEFRGLPAIGGSKMTDKLRVLWQAPKVLRQVKKAVAESDWFQFRAPTGIGVYVIPYLMCTQKSGWFKYAGNWKQEAAPWSYRFQRWLLMHQKRKVTINGHWPDQPNQCLTFENPCLTVTELEKGVSAFQTKKPITEGVVLCFVGRLEEAKGVDVFLNALKELPDSLLKQLDQVHVVGTGPEIARYQNLMAGFNIPVLFHGLLSRVDVHNIYAESHGIVLPTQSEGFPKVISEAMAYGCVPMVSSVSAIGQYVTVDTGFLLDDLKIETLVKTLSSFLDLTTETYQNMGKQCLDGVKKFSYASYGEHLKEVIL
ncbi:glycosyltransferase [Mangrovimonas futianensis]|uniref:glycosyltransferase n=1 Tax=Mangrovimonas futianensis TaxID=2895523 RepID=UPI001E2A83A8|nr:glycosyltransferase [Mangrovimonas futianensis]MCF1421414.1 glycosyltransferase [Mangrovimonas futianensis]